MSHIFSNKYLKQKVEELVIAGELDLGWFDALRRVLRHLEHEDALVEHVLETLVGRVDAQLLETVNGERFKPGHVQDTNG